MTGQTTNQRDWDEKALIQELRQQQRQSEMIGRWYAQHPEEVEEREFYQQVQDKAAQQIQLFLGVEPETQGHNSPFDLLVGNARVEVKGSHWQQAAHRYQADIRHHAADLVMFDAVNGTDHWFIIPMTDLAPRRTIEVYSYDVEVYNGQWKDYLEAWFLLVEAVVNAPKRAKQLSLREFGDVGTDFWPLSDRKGACPHKGV